MKKVFQTRYGKGNGNCFQAAIASILELPFEEVPDFCNQYTNQKYYDEFVKWLNTKGYSAIPLMYETTLEYLKGCYYLASGINDNGIRHCVIFKDGKQIHNPNKRCQHEDIKPDMVDIIFPLNPVLKE